MRCSYGNANKWFNDKISKEKMQSTRVSRRVLISSVGSKGLILIVTLNNKNLIEFRLCCKDEENEFNFRDDPGLYTVFRDSVKSANNSANGLLMNYFVMLLFYLIE